MVVYTHAGVMENSSRRLERKATKSGAGAYSIGEPIPAWGDVSFGIEAYDRMTGTANKYGVHQVDLYVDDSLFFSTYIYRYSFDETRYINSFTEDGTVVFTTDTNSYYWIDATVEAVQTGPDFPPIWDDDDEYVPPIVPVQPEESSDDTVTIVACAAAAVVAALIAAYLIIDRRQ